MDMFNSTQMLSVSPKGGGGTGTSDYNELTGKPSISGVVLEGDKTLDSLNIQAKGDYSTNANVDSKITSHNANNTSHNDIRAAIPTKTSQLTNDSGYATTSQLPDISVKVDKTTTVNGKPLSSNVTLTQDDVASGTNNKAFSNADKTKLDSIVIGSGGNINVDVTAHNADVNAHPSIKNMLTLDAQSKSNFDFIQNKVVQDGLVSVDFSKHISSNDASSEKVVVPVGNIFFVSFGFSIAQLNQSMSMLCQTNIGWQTYISYEKGNKRISSSTLFDGFGVVIGDMPLKSTIAIYCDQTNKIGRIYLNGECIVSKTYSTMSNISELYPMWYSNTSDRVVSTFTNILNYNRPLTQQEIQHNINVLNNSPSVNALTVTDASSNKTTLLFSSDTSHIEGRGGVLQDQFNADYYKSICKEFTSNDGSDITVANGWRGYVNSFTMTGQTVKNIADISTTSDTNYFKTITHSNNWAQYDIPFTELDRNKKYKIRYEIIENTLTVPFYLASSVNVQNVFMDISFVVNAGTVGIFEKEFTPSPTNNAKLLRMQVSNNVGTGKIVLRCTITEQIVNSYIPFGLSSTKASLTNNGIKYNFYMQDGSAIDLGGVGVVGNTLDGKEDGSGVATQNTKEAVLNGGENWVIHSLGTTVSTIAFKLDLGTRLSPATINVVSNMFLGVASNNYYDGDIESITSNGVISIRILKSKLTTQDVNGFKAWLAQNPTTVRYQLATPIVTSIPKEKMPCVLTSFNQNIISFSDAVKAASCVLTMPTNDMLKKDYVITLLNNYTQVAGSFNPRLSLRNDNKVELSLDLMSSATYNPTIMMLPVELRPKTDVKLNGFVDNISTPIIIKKTGEVQVPNSIISKNVYVKDTYRIF